MGKGNARVKAKYTSKYFLPEDVISLIIALGTLEDMKRWREVSRVFRLVVDRSPIFQYLVLLNQLGYIEPINPRQDLSYREKAERLCGHQKKLQNLTGSGYVAVDHRGVQGHPFRLRFFRGLFAHLNARSEGTEADEIVVYELPSLKKTFPQCEVWGFDTWGPITEYYVDRSMDLVVSFICDSTNDSDIPVLTVDLRSFNTGWAHPAVAKARLELPVTDALESIHYSLTGDYLMALLDCDSSDDTYDIVGWDWPSGKQIMHMRIESRDSFAFVWPNVLVIPSSLSNIDKDLEQIGYLDIYTFDSNGKEGAPRHIATLQLPETADKNATTYITVYPSRSSFIKSRTVPEIETESRLYDIPPEDGVVCVKILYFRGIRDQNILYPRPRSSGILLIHHASILDIIHSLPQSGHPHVVPWFKWAHKTVWTGASLEDIHTNHFTSFGHIFAFLRDREIVLYDLRPCFLTVDVDAFSRFSRHETYRSQPVQAAVLNSLFKSGKNRACDPKILSSFAIPEWIELIEPVITLDDEHG
ncbi:unnamed protein product [Rhizoctonia solani]|uniref:F-box domain-containing protein n=1 Tax=Rhizoctonia solani TaxID=456999 RepID=A0A8H3BM01_9AGAM|nr:unnamed protein product [Rhizoctonia solani]